MRKAQQHTYTKNDGRDLSSILSIGSLRLIWLTHWAMYVEYLQYKNYSGQGAEYDRTELTYQQTMCHWIAENNGYRTVEGFQNLQKI